MKRNAKNGGSAFDTAVYYLTFRDHSQKELISKLKQKGYNAPEIEQCVNKLSEYGYLDDQRYALSYIKGHIQSRGKRRIAQELSGKGIDNEITGELFDSFEYEEEDMVFSLLERRYRTLDFDDEGQLRRMYSFFARRGFRYEDIRRAVSRYRQNIDKT